MIVFTRGKASCLTNKCTKKHFFKPRFCNDIASRFGGVMPQKRDTFIDFTPKTCQNMSFERVASQKRATFVDLSMPSLMRAMGNGGDGDDGER